MNTVREFELQTTKYQVVQVKGLIKVLTTLIKEDCLRLVVLTNSKGPHIRRVEVCMFSTDEAFPGLASSWDFMGTFLLPITYETPEYTMMEHVWTRRIIP